MSEKKKLEAFKEQAKKNGYIILENRKEKFSKEMFEAMTDETWLIYARAAWNEQKKNARNNRCSVRGKRGKSIRCPEGNRCSRCPYAAKDSQGNPQPGNPIGNVLSLELFEEMGISFPNSLKVETQVEKRELTATLHTALTSLSEYEYHIIILAAGGMSEREIADKVGSKQRTINDQKRRIRAHLKKVLEDYL